MRLHKLGLLGWKIPVGIVGKYTIKKGKNRIFLFDNSNDNTTTFKDNIVYKSSSSTAVNLKFGGSTPYFLLSRLVFGKLFLKIID